MTPTVRVKVRPNCTVSDGQSSYGGGEHVTVDAELAEEWLAAGWVQPFKKVT